ncbi:hypothetical protein [Micromonospora aurantiaca (nom. illeg.)]|uniref:hypothetical protein n=1 Tax=Micromonospora aurantiaca (nom. illeg.) TaxID=47850 RepID=UPI001F0C2A63|nr:hypothetical protein [Micromonospora aurantiaca]
MNSISRLTLIPDTVREFAEPIAAAAQHADPVDDESAGPALLLVADDGGYLLSNGLP